MEQVALTTTEFKALSSDTRIKFLKLLEVRNFTLSELSVKMNMAAPTLKQHATILIESGLIELKDEGRKWKYYSLTRKGKKILESKEKQTQTNFLIILSSTIIFIGFIGIAAIISTQQLASTGADIEDKPILEAGIDSNDKAKILGTESIEAKCTPFFKVEENLNPNTGISATQEFAANCYNTKTREECEKIDIYNENQKAFGTSDGTADCKWTN